MKIAAYLLWAAAGGFLMRFELHTDDAGVVVFLIVVIAFVLGAMHPVHAWQWALLVGPCVPAAHLLFGTAPAPRDTLLLLAFVIGLGLAGAYAGVLARKTFARGG